MIHEYIWGTEDWLYQDNGLLIKRISANDNLSIQVHPDDEYAKKKAMANGKTECWFITKAKKGAFLYCGFIDNVSIDDIKNSLLDGSIEKYLKKIPVSRGDFIYIPAGTVHAICSGIELIEVQQDSTCTYRLFDYNRKDQAGNPRQLHIEDGLASIKLDSKGGKNALPFECKYFEISVKQDHLIVKKDDIKLEYEI